MSTTDDDERLAFSRAWLAAERAHASALMPESLRAEEGEDLWYLPPDTSPMPRLVAESELATAARKHMDEQADGSFLARSESHRSDDLAADLAKLPPDELAAWQQDLALFGTAMLEKGVDGTVRRVAARPGAWVVVSDEEPPR